jgi:hypothetical protein
MQHDTPRRLRYASGYIELNLLNEASDELEAIASRTDSRRPCLPSDSNCTWRRSIGMRSSASRVVLADSTPENERGWICWAYALRELHRIEEARDVLLLAEPLHGKTSAILHFNLGCYYCLLGNLDTARERVRRSCQMQEAFKKDALEDPDLETLWVEF